MEFQKGINLLDGTTNQPSKFKTRNWAEMIDESRGKYDTSSTEFKISMIRSDLCNYSDAYILVSAIITITGAGDDNNAKRTDERNGGVTFKSCALFTNCVSRINNIQIDNAEYMDVVMSMYKLTECSDNYKTAESLWQYYRDDQNDNITQFESFKYNIKITGNTPAAGNTKDVKTAVLSKYLTIFGITLEISLINCEIGLDLPWSKKCYIFCSWNN